ncbi:unnamed protein product [Rotaria sp. Silwood2]|nr:unnamed protein product [Rotaria sp. Silwood2]
MLASTTESTIKLLLHLKLLPTKPNDNDPCPKACNEWYIGTSYVFRCKKCKATKSIRQGSFFSGSHLSLATIIGNNL